ncbi:MAG: hypothetical protein U0521_04720 [Anaerolineae bacterium]
MDNGFNIVDFMDLPAFERCVVRLLLREAELTYAELVEAVGTLPEDQQMDQDRLDAALEYLSGSQWLVGEGEGQKRRYRVICHRATAPRIAGCGMVSNWSIDQHGAFQVDLEPSAAMLSVRSGGKRAPQACVGLPD